MERKRGIAIRTTVSIGAMLVLVTSLVACSGPFGGDGADEPNEVAGSCVPAGTEDGFLSFEEYRAGLACLVTDFQWPEGKVPDEAMLEQTLQNFSDPQNSEFERGLVYANMAGLNSCAWRLTWLEARQRGDVATEQEALEYMTGVIPNFETLIPNYPANITDPSTVQFNRDVAAQAALGNPRLVQEAVRYCLPWTTDS